MSVSTAMAAKRRARYVLENANNRIARRGLGSRPSPTACHTNAPPNPTAATRYTIPIDSKAKSRSVVATTITEYTMICRTAVVMPLTTGSIGMPAAS